MKLLLSYNIHHCTHETFGVHDNKIILKILNKVGIQVNNGTVGTAV